MEPARGSRLPLKRMHFSICRKRSSFDWLCTPVLCPTSGIGVTTDCSKHPEKPSLSVVGCSGGDGFCDLAGGLYHKTLGSIPGGAALSLEPGPTLVDMVTTGFGPGRASKNTVNAL